jgi:hypothetical protein
MFIHPRCINQPAGRQRIYRSHGFAQGNGYKLRALRLGFVLLLAAAALPVYAQDFVPERVVFPIGDFKPDIKRLAVATMKFATGFCLDPDCRFVGTNYHVAKEMGEYVRIKGVFSVHRYVDSGQDDIGSRDVPLFEDEGSEKYTPAHDLAIYEMRHPLKHFHGIAFDVDDLKFGLEADIYAYPFKGNPKRGLVRWHAKYIGKSRPDGLLAFQYEGGGFRGGASGGIVIDSNTKKIVGILHGAATNLDHVLLAVPVRELSDFVARAQPYLQATVFPTTVFISPVAADLHRPHAWRTSEALSQRPTETPEVHELRHRAQRLADSMRNFSAIETFAWGHGDHRPEATDAYETLILDGLQTWRLPGTEKSYKHVPFPPLSYGSLVPGAEWSYLPLMVGTALDLKINQASDTTMGGRTIHVFQYAGSAEDRVCTITYVFMSFGPLELSKRKIYDCHGEVWTDESGNILRISENYDRPGFRAVMTYGWLEKDGRKYPVPVTLTTELGMYWCRGLFTDYQMFGVKSHWILSSEEPKESTRAAQ